MLYIGIPSFNEAPTIGVLLWRIRKTFQDYSREYEVVVYDDGSTDGTAGALEPYARVLPLTVVRGEARQGYGHALDALCATVARRTRYPRRDALLVMQGDFTDQPEMIPELVKRFEGGADIVSGVRDRRALPVATRRLARLAPWAVRAWMSPVGEDPFASFRLYRISLLRDYQKAHPGEPVVASDGWGANLELFVRLSALARRVEEIAVTPRYDLRFRESRIRPWADAWALYQGARAARGWRGATPSRPPNRAQA